MRRFLLLSLLPVLAAGPASAGLNIAWDDCLHGGGVRSKTFACDNNDASPTHHLYLSATAPDGITAWVAFEWMVDVLSTDSMDLPDWWYLRGAGMCRNGALSAAAIPASGAGCTDPHQGQAAGGIASYTVDGSSIIRGRIKGVWAVPLEYVTPMVAGEEYLVTRVSLSNLKSTGAGSCAGCSVGGCLVAFSVTFVQSGSFSVVDQTPDESVVAGWQGPHGVNDCGTCNAAGKAGFSTCAICPTQNVTWSRLKAIYR